MESKFRKCPEDRSASAARTPASACSPPGRSGSAPASPNTRAACSTTKEAERLEARGNLYLYEINSRWTIDGTPRSNIARYFNHSCNPNAEMYDVKRRVFIRTLRTIKPGEEITYDYGVDYLKNVIGRSNCKCGRCRRRRARKARERRALHKRRAARLAGKPKADSARKL